MVGAVTSPSSRCCHQTTKRTVLLGSGSRNLCIIATWNINSKRTSIRDVEITVTTNCGKAFSRRDSFHRKLLPSEANKAFPPPNNDLENDHESHLTCVITTVSTCLLNMAIVGPRLLTDFFLFQDWDRRSRRKSNVAAVHLVSLFLSKREKHGKHIRPFVARARRFVLVPLYHDDDDHSTLYVDRQRQQQQQQWWRRTTVRYGSAVS